MGLGAAIVDGKIQAVGPSLGGYIPGARTILAMPAFVRSCLAAG